MKYVIVSMDGNACNYSVRVYGNVLNKEYDEITIEEMAGNLSASDFRKWLKEKYSDYALIILCVCGDIEVIKAQPEATKNTPRYIDAGKIKYCEVFNGEPTEMAFRSSIEKLPTEDVVPVIHAHWYGCNSLYRCSACNRIGGGANSRLRKPYCGWCGAKMDEEDQVDNV